MFEKLLALRYIRVQKRHSILSVCSIAIAIALMTLLFTAYSTFMGIRRDLAYDAAPYHVKILDVTPEEWSILARSPDLSECRRVTEPDGTQSAALLIAGYHESLGVFLNALLPDKGIFDGFTFDGTVIVLNEKLLTYDCVDVQGRASAAQSLALFYVFLIFIIMSLRLLIDTAFEVSSKERERQFGVLQSIGATPVQIVRIITFEGLVLCVIGIPAGLLLGLGLSVAAFQAVLTSGIGNALSTPEKANALLQLHIHPLYLAIGAVTGLVWVLLSAYGTGMRIVKMSPIQAISGRSSKVSKVRRHSLFGLLFGWKGKLAARNNHRSFKRFLVTVISLTLSITLFSSFTFVLDQVEGTYRKALTYTGTEEGMLLSFQQDPDDPLNYRTGYDLITNSGYFDVVDYSKTKLAYYWFPGEERALCIVMYLPREVYEKQFDGAPPMSYDELTASGGYILMDDPMQSEQSAAKRLHGSKTLTMQYQTAKLVTQAEYDAMSDEERESVRTFSDETDEGGTSGYYVNEDCETSVPIVGEGMKRQEEYVYEMNDDTFYLISTLDIYDAGGYETFGVRTSFGNGVGKIDTILVNLKDPAQYNDAKEFLSWNAELISLEEDYFGAMQLVSTMLASVRIGCGFLSVLIGLIALVNLVNILSTGILNRRQELAALQCIGMTRGQLYGMTVIECLQYVFFAAILSFILTEGLMLGTQVFMRLFEIEETQQSMVSFTAPIPRVLLSSLAAFLAALAASFLPLRRMERDSLTDQLRSVD